MANYTQATFFTFRDSLATSDNRKKGDSSLFEGEFDLVETESNLKLDKVSGATLNNVALFDTNGALKDGGGIPPLFNYVPLDDPELVYSDDPLAYAALNLKTTASQASGTINTQNPTQWKVRVVCGVSTSNGADQGYNFKFLVYKDSSDTTGKPVGARALIREIGISTRFYIISEFDFKFTNGNEITFEVETDLPDVPNGFNTSSFLYIYAVGYYE